MCPGFNVYSGNTDLSNYVFTRFIPAYFSVNTTFDYSAYCGSFSYRGLKLSSYNSGDESGPIDLTPHIVELTAKNAFNSTTTYYDADLNSAFYYDTSGVFASRTYTHSGDNVSIDIETATVNFVQGDVSDGVFSFEMPNDDITFTKAESGHLVPISTGTETGDFNISFELDENSLKDQDGVGVKSTYSDSDYQSLSVEGVISGIEIREGRLRIENATTPADLVDMLILAEYYKEAEEGSEDGSWELNEQDSCTVIDLENAKVLNLTDTTLSAVNLLFGEDLETEGQAPLVGGIGTGAQGIKIGVVYVDEDNPTGQVQAGYEIPDEFEFLRYPWCEDDYYGSTLGVQMSCENPAAEFNFGQARGNDRIIHWREVLR